MQICFWKRKKSARKSLKLYFRQILCRIMEGVRGRKIGVCKKYSKNSFKKKQDCADFFGGSWYYNNCKNPPIHYIVFATPHKKKYLLQKRQSKDWRFYLHNIWVWDRIRIEEDAV